MTKSEKLTEEILATARELGERAADLGGVLVLVDEGLMDKAAEKLDDVISSLGSELSELEKQRKRLEDLLPC